MRKKSNRLHRLVDILSEHVVVYLADGGTYTALAELSGVSHQTIRNWVTGNTLNPQLPKFVKVAEALDLEVYIK